MYAINYLVTEIYTGLEIFYLSRTTKYYKTAFILCDNYTELLAKAYLLHMNNNWIPNQSNDPTKKYFKNYKQVQEDLEAIRNEQIIKDLHRRMLHRRNRRNEFFHSTTLIDLDVKKDDVVNAFCDLLDYGKILFNQPSPNKHINLWDEVVSSTGNLNTLITLLQIDKRGQSRPDILPKFADIFLKSQNYPKNSKQKVPYEGHILLSSSYEGYWLLCIGQNGDLKRQLEELLKLYP